MTNISGGLDVAGTLNATNATFHGTNEFDTVNATEIVSGSLANTYAYWNGSGVLVGSNAPTYFLLTAVDNIPTNVIPASTSTRTNWVLLNWTNTGPVYIATNIAASGSFLRRVPTTTLSVWP